MSKDSKTQAVYKSLEFEENKENISFFKTKVPVNKSSLITKNNGKEEKRTDCYTERKRHKRV